jgi:hypothetical protein
MSIVISLGMESKKQLGFGMDLISSMDIFLSEMTYQHEPDLDVNIIVQVRFDDIFEICFSMNCLFLFHYKEQMEVDDEV